MDGNGDAYRWALSGPVRPDFLRHETLVDIFLQSARRGPTSRAIGELGSTQALTYAELDALTNRLAHELAACGVRRGDRVGLWFRRSIDLHVAMLGVLKAGAAFLPFDADAPAERINRCLADCGAGVLLTHEAMGEAPAAITATVLTVGIVPDGACPPPATRADPDDLAYIIYTSGSTGEPKGIPITHRNVCHYLRAVNECLRVTERDIVLQQASVAFDLSIEEIFVSYLAGATIKVATEASLRDLDRLADVLEADRVSVIDTVPTFLSMLERVPRTVRLVVVGGEACPAALVDRLAASGCRIVNTYGPTETTVVATAGDLMRGEGVTIGTPLANYTAYVVDDRMAPVAAGGVGELLIGGPGVAGGYVGRAELTAARFIANPFLVSGGMDPVLYRTGDAVSIDRKGRLVFHGRIDQQVKIRGYRIELGEIEALIVREPGVRAVAASVPNAGGGNVLVAHLVVDTGFEEARSRASLAAQLPAYMLPTFWCVHEELPRLASGKVDRKALAALPLPVVQKRLKQNPAASVTERRLLDAAASVLGTADIHLDADFFTELGGHSLLAAQFVSEVRKVPQLAGIALQDVYSARTLRRIARLLDERARDGEEPAADLSFTPPPLGRRFLCGLAQAIALPFIIMIVTAQWIGLLLASIYLVRDEASLATEVIVLSGIFVALNLGAKVIVVALKWLVIGRTRPGVYPLWGSYYFRIWLVQRLVHLTSHKFLQGSPLMRIYLRALGADIGRDAVIHELEEGAIDLLSIGARASIGSKVRFANVEVIGNEVHVGRIDIGEGAYVGNACVIAGDTVLGAHCELGDLTAVAAGARIAPGERWDGAPAHLVGHVDPQALPAHPGIGPLRRLLQTSGYFVAYNIVMMVGLLPIFPAFYVLAHVDALTFGDRDNVVPWQWVLLLAWPAALALVFASMLVVIVMRWVLFPRRVKPGRHSIHSGFYFRKWVMSLATETMLETLNSLYATVFMRNWYRLMGTRVGKGTEISANFSGRYDLIELGQNNFIGDEAIFGDEEVRNGWMALAPASALTFPLARRNHL